MATNIDHKHYHRLFNQTLSESKFFATNSKKAPALYNNYKGFINFMHTLLDIKEGEFIDTKVFKKIIDKINDLGQIAGESTQCSIYYKDTGTTNNFIYRVIDTGLNNDMGEPLFMLQCLNVDKTPKLIISICNKSYITQSIESNGGRIEITQMVTKRINLDDLKDDFFDVSKKFLLDKDVVCAFAQELSVETKDTNHDDPWVSDPVGGVRILEHFLLARFGYAVAFNIFFVDGPMPLPKSSYREKFNAILASECLIIHTSLGKDDQNSFYAIVDIDSSEKRLKLNRICKRDGVEEFYRDLSTTTQLSLPSKDHNVGDGYQAHSVNSSVFSGYNEKHIKDERLCRLSTEYLKEHDYQGDDSERSKTEWLNSPENKAAKEKVFDFVINSLNVFKYHTPDSSNRSFYPRFGYISCMFPIMWEERPIAVAIIGHFEGNPRFNTILDMNMAFTNSRLLSYVNNTNWSHPDYSPVSVATSTVDYVEIETLGDGLVPIHDISDDKSRYVISIDFGTTNTSAVIFDKEESKSTIIEFAENRLRLPSYVGYKKR